MSTETRRPTADLNSGFGTSNSWAIVDDAVSSPTAGSGDVVTVSGDSTATQQWTLQTPVNSGPITSATIFVRVRFDSNSDGAISAARFRLNGTWYSATVGVAPSGGTFGYMSATASGSYGELSGSAPAVELTYTGATIDATMEIDVVYLDINYTATVTKTIKASGGDYATPALAAAAWNAGTISGAVAGDDIVFTIDDATRFASTFQLTANPTNYASVRLTTSVGSRHNGTPGSGGGLAPTTGTSGHIVHINMSTNPVPAVIEWLEITTNGGKWNSGVYFQTIISSGAHVCRNNLIYNNGQPTAADCPGIRVTGSATDVHNNLIANWKSQSTAAAYGIWISAGTGAVTRRLQNNTIYDIDCSGSGTCRGVASVGTTFTLQNNVIVKVGTSTSGTKECIGGSVPATRGYNATSDTTATGTGVITSIVEADTFSNSGSNDFRPKNSASIYQTGIDLVTTPSGVEIDLKGFDRDTSGLAWSIGAYQEGSTPADTISLTSPTARQTKQRDGSGNATFSVIGTYSNAVAGGGIQYRWAGGSWTTLVASPTGGTFSTSVTLSTGQGTFEVRLANATSVTASAALVTVGDVYAIFGQSNASGRGTNNRSYSGSFSVNQYTGSGWVNLADPADDDAKVLDSVALDSGLASGHWCHKMATDLMTEVGVPVGIVIVAKGGTGITSFVAGANHLDRSTLYGSLNYHLNQIGGCKVVLWWQGETDAVAGMSQATYNSNLDTIANDLQTDRGVKLMPCLLQNSTGITDANEIAIRSAVTQAVGDNANVILGPDFSAIISDDSFHLQTDVKVDNAGAAWAQSIIAEFFPSISAVAVSTQSVLLVGTSTTITWDSIGTSGTVDILLSLDSGSSFPITIANDTADDGSFVWTPEAAHLTTTGVVRVVDSVTSSIRDDQTVVIASTEPTGSGTNTAEWSAVREMLSSAGVEIVRL
jgi:hypothetical protein